MSLHGTQIKTFKHVLDSSLEDVNDTELKKALRVVQQFLVESELKKKKTPRFFWCVNSQQLSACWEIRLRVQTAEISNWSHLCNRIFFGKV